MKSEEQEQKKHLEKAQEEELQEKYVEFQLLQKQIQQLTQNLNVLNQQLAEVMESVQSIQEIADVKPDTEILVPITNGIFAVAKLRNSKELLVNVGSDTIVEKNVPSVLELLEKQRTEIEQTMGEADTYLQALTQRATEVYAYFKEKGVAEE